jgi:hypothetical protein
LVPELVLRYQRFLASFCQNDSRTFKVARQFEQFAWREGKSFIAVELPVPDGTAIGLAVEGFAGAADDLIGMLDRLALSDAAKSSQHKRRNLCFWRRNR